MSKLLYEREDNVLNINEFYGGSKRGVCVQLTTDDGYVQLTRKQVKDTMEVLSEWLGEAKE